MDIKGVYRFNDVNNIILYIVSGVYNNNNFIILYKVPMMMVINDNIIVTEPSSSIYTVAAAYVAPSGMGRDAAAVAIPRRNVGYDCCDALTHRSPDINTYNIEYI